MGNGKGQKVTTICKNTSFKNNRFLYLDKKFQLFESAYRFWLTFVDQ